MYDRPYADELITAARQHLETQIIPLAKATNFKLYFQTLVAINVLKIAERELNLRDNHMTQTVARLMALLERDDSPSTTSELTEAIHKMNAKLSDAIRQGDWDDGEKVDALFEHLHATTIAQLEVANPKYLAQLAQEDSSSK